MLNTKNIKPTSSFVVKAIDVGVHNGINIGGISILDQSSYVWTTGYCAGHGLTNPSSTPAAVLPTRQYSSLISHAFGALDNSSYAWTWGNGATYGCLGTNNATNWNVPKSVVGAKRWLFLDGVCMRSGSSNDSVTYVGLDFSSYAWAWGCNTNGYIGDKTVSHRSSPVSVVGNKQWIQISLGANHVLALDNLSYAWAWGYYTNNLLENVGQLGDNATVGRSSPVSVVGGRQFVSIYTLHYTSYGLDASSYLWGWGDNGQGQLADGTITHRSSPISISSDAWTKIYPLGNGTNATGNRGFVLGFKGNNAYVWGCGSFLTSYMSNSTPIAVNFPWTIKKLISSFHQNASQDIFILQETNSNVWVWGLNGSTQSLGVGDFVYKNVPTKVLLSDQQKYSYFSPPQAFLKMFDQGYILDQSSYLWGWGSGGLLPYTSNSPVSITTSIQFRDLVISQTTAIGLDINSYAWAWGANNYGQLGNNNIFSGTVSSFVSVVGDKQWIKVIARNENTWGIDSQSYVWAWGNGNFGANGDNTVSNRSSPVSVLGNIQAIDIAAGAGYHAVILNSNSYLWAWGRNTSGFLGDNTAAASRSSPVSVVGNRQFRKIVGSWGAYCAMDASSYLWAWGQNDNGILGDNTTTNRSSPVSVMGGRQLNFDNLEYTKNSLMYFAAKDANSYLWAWGINTSSQICDGTTNNRSSPVSVNGNYQFRNIYLCLDGIIGTLSAYPASEYYAGGVFSTVKAIYYGTAMNIPYFVKVEFAQTTMQGSPVVITRKNILSR